MPILLNPPKPHNQKSGNAPTPKFNNGRDIPAKNLGAPGPREGCVRICETNGIKFRTMRRQLSPLSLSSTPIQP